MSSNNHFINISDVHWLPIQDVYSVTVIYNDEEYSYITVKTTQSQIYKVRYSTNEQHELEDNLQKIIMTLESFKNKNQISNSLEETQLDEYWEVEKILKERKNEKTNKIEYLVK